MSSGFTVIHNETINGFECEITEVTWSGHLNGYVKIPEDHPFYNEDYDNIPVTVHGGLTYADKHDDGSFWVGFDCAHYGDLLPKSPIRTGGVFRDKEYVLNELKSLTKQIAELKDAKKET